jgi:hypothetical protein
MSPVGIELLKLISFQCFITFPTNITFPTTAITAYCPTGIQQIKIPRHLFGAGGLNLFRWGLKYQA